MNFFYLITVLAITYVSSGNGENNTDLALIRKLMAGYDPGVRPVLDESHVINMSVSVNKLQLLNVDQAEETVLFSAEFILVWYDAFLFWDPKDYKGLEWIKMKEILIWKPDVTVSTSISKNTLLSEKERFLDIRYDGRVRKSLYAVYTNLCNMQVDRFPYDSQICAINIGPWSYTAKEVWCTSEGDFETKPDSFEGNSEWDFVSLNSSFSMSTDDDVGFNYTEISFQLRVKRRPLFYVWVLLIPTYIITTVCIFGLFIPTNSIGDREEKVNLGLTTLLSSAVILQIVANSMPKTSELPLLGNFILSEIFVVAIGVLVSVVVLVFHNRAFTREWQPPAWVLYVLRMSGSKRFINEKSKKKHGKIYPEDVKKTNTATDNLAELDSALNELTGFIEDHEKDRTRELIWLKFFDRVDTCLLVLFQISNTIIMYVVCKE